MKLRIKYHRILNLYACRDPKCQFICFEGLGETPYLAYINFFTKITVNNNPISPLLYVGA